MKIDLNKRDVELIHKSLLTKIQSIHFLIVDRTISDNEYTELNNDLESCIKLVEEIEDKKKGEEHLWRSKK